MGRARDEHYEDDDQPKRRRRDEDEDDEAPRKRRREEDDDERPRKKKKGKGLLIALIVGGVGVVVLVILLIVLFSGRGLQSRLAGKWKTERKQGGGPFKRVHSTTFEFQSGGKYSREELTVEENEVQNFVDGKVTKEKEVREFRITLTGEFKVGTHKLFGDIVSLQPLKKEMERKKNGKKEETEKDKKGDKKDEEEELQAEIYSVIIVGETLAFQPMGMGREGTLKRMK